MAKNRVIPFGYCMRNGEITVDFKESKAVVKIFEEYLNGSSLMQIAKLMESEKVRYSEYSDRWNKNMVKRIIENEKYLGNEKYPQIISEKFFIQANEKRASKATSMCVISEDLQEIRNRTYCLECGHRLSRIGGNCRSAKWDCRNPDCYRLEYQLTDQMIIGAVLTVLNAMCKNKKIDLVITKSISRFARNTVDCLEYVRQLKDLGIGVIFEKENINTLTMTSEFMIALYGSFAQAESESISKNVSWGKEKAYREGKVAFQYKNLLGYKKGDDGKPEIVPDEAETVKMIFKLYLDGYTLLNIAQSLMKQNRLTALGKNVWTKGEVQRILKNEKYVGDALLQKTFTVDCITHKVMKNNGERPMYLVTDHHDPIVDRDTFNRVQQELARRSGKRKISDKTKTEQGKYSGKYSLSELMICGCCGTPYRRKIWMKNSVKLAVWRCISRLEHGKKYCPDSPTIKEEQLHKAIIRAINNYYSCRDDIARILKANIGTVLECQGQEEMISIENRLKEIDQARNDLVSLIASGGCDEDKLDSEFSKLYQEEQLLSERLETLKSQNKTSAETQAKLDKIMDMIEHEKFELETFDNVLIRKLIECVKVLSKTEILVIFKGGYEVKTDIE